MDLLRSEDMKYVSITMATDAAHSTVRELGKLQKLHVIDLGAGESGQPSKEHTHFKKRLADCQYWERKLNGLSEELVKFDIPNEGAITNVDYVPQEIHSADILSSVQQLVEPLERDLNLSINFLKENRRLIATLVERRHTLMLTKDLDLAGQARMLQRQASASSDPSSRSLLQAAGSSSSSSPSPDSFELEMKDEEAGSRSQRDPNAFRNYICGIIAVDQQPMFRRMLYRVSRGNAFARFADIAGTIADPATGEFERKSVFYVMVLGQQLLQRITRMCDLFKATIYELPATKEEFHSQLNQIRADMLDKESVNHKTEDSIVALLTRLGNENGTSPLKNFQVALQEEKSICAVMMKAHYYQSMIVIEGWVPVADMNALKTAVKAAVAGTGHPPAAIEVDPSNPIKLAGLPPTHFNMTKFTSPYQGIVNTYGTPRYKEVNPGLFTLISFPFLFGVMYGDIGHGTLLSLAAAAMIYWEDKLLAKQKAGTLGEIPGMVFGGRYMLISMGLFAVYCGIMYNDCLSIPTNVYGSGWVDDVTVATTGKMINPTGWTYPCGIDPAWSHKTNELAFYNSLKMKMAIVFGVTHMIFGIVLSVFNYLYYKDYLSVYFEFIPKLVFMLSTFGYMAGMIIYKWTQDWYGTGRAPPNLIQTMISMFLSPTQNDTPLYSGQIGFQCFLLFLAFISIPTMLLVKPLINKKRHEREAITRALQQQQADRGAFDENKEDEHAGGGHGAAAAGGEHEEVHSFSDEMIHQSIHTIEFVLGAVSNTASYLRLWALSLAHAELSGVFFDKMMMQYGALTNNPFMMFIGFGLWAGATFAVLLCMDVLECFLHALRLHWVEFQSKFYHADGIAFEPFTLTPEEDTK